jgi:hypothetical protein
MDKHSSLLDPFVSYSKISDVNTAPGIDLIQLFLFTPVRVNKLECLSLAIGNPSQQSLIFERKTRAHSRAPLKWKAAGGNFRK